MTNHFTYTDNLVAQTLFTVDSEILYWFCGLPKCEQQETLNRVIILTESVRNMGIKGALELLYKLAQWMERRELR